MGNNLSNIKPSLGDHTYQDVNHDLRKQRLRVHSSTSTVQSAEYGARSTEGTSQYRRGARSAEYRAQDVPQNTDANTKYGARSANATSKSGLRLRSRGGIRRATPYGPRTVSLVSRKMIDFRLEQIGL
eukprot:6602842-Prymnesium_polylepis.1